MARFILILLALCAAALPLFAHAYVFETMDGVLPQGDETGVTLFNMAWASLPVALAALMAHRRRAFLFGVLAFAAEAALWGYYAVSGRAVQIAPPDVPGGGADIGLGLAMLVLPLLFGLVILMGTGKRERASGLRF